MKIAFFTDIFFPLMGGVQTSLGTLAAGLAQNGHDVYIYAPKPKKGNHTGYAAKGVTVRLVDSLPLPIYKDLRISLPFSPKILLELKSLKIDIIHFHTPGTLGATAIMTARFLQIPVVSTFHGYFMEPEYLKLFGIKNNVKFVSKTLWNYSKFFMNLSDGIITPAVSTKNDLLRNGFEKEITVINNTIDTTQCKKVSDDTVQKLKHVLGLKEKVILYVGRLSPEKNLDKLIASFTEITKTENNVSLLIIGDGPARNTLEKLVKSKHVHDSIVFSGEISQHELLQKGYYQVGDIFATASESEVQPVSIIEAFYFGLPVVGVSKRGNSEILKESGLLSKSNNVPAFTKNLLSLVQNKALRDEFRQKSLNEFKEKYDMKASITKYETYYSSFIH